MKEYVRLLILGQTDRFFSDWNAEHSYQLDDLTVPYVESYNPLLVELKGFAMRYPEVKLSERIERKYTFQELQNFAYFFFWVNGSCDLKVPDYLVQGPPCSGCGYRSESIPPGPYVIGRKPKKDFCHSDYQILIVTDRIADSFRTKYLTGAEFVPVMDLKGRPHGAVMTATESVETLLYEEIAYDGQQCVVCGRFDATYVRAPSGEIIMPLKLVEGSDYVYFHANRDRRPGTWTIISQRFYRSLLEIKATGFWVQPIHVV